ncbi:hypothetical protein [Paenibacillus ginsengarvi]|nr:hypothetical protein [Paenibacillus ginsengarvi]
MTKKRPGLEATDSQPGAERVIRLPAPELAASFGLLQFNHAAA